MRTNMISSKAALLLSVAGVAVAEPSWSWTASPTIVSSTPALATVTPCPWAPSDFSISPITVTSQYQTVSTCSPTSACVKGFCQLSADCTEYAFVSTVIPCGYDGTTSTFTTITGTDDAVTVSNYLTTITSYAPVPTALWKFQHKRPKPTAVYTTIVKEFSAAYSDLSSWVMPDFEGSGLCDNCSPYADGTSYQPLNVTECRASGGDAQCSSYIETWVSAPVPATTTVTTETCSSAVTAPTAGTYTWTFAVTPSAPAITAGPTGYSYAPEPWFYEATKTYHGPWQGVISEIVTQTITLTVPFITQPATTTSSVPFPTGTHFPGFPFQAPAGPAPTGGAQYIQVFDSGAKYHSGASYIGFSEDDAIIVTDKSLAATFTFQDGQLVVDGAFVGADFAWGYQAFQKYSTAPKLSSGWSLDGDHGVSWDFGSGSASFCVTPDKSLFVALTGSPSFACKPVDLSAGGSPPTTSSSTTWTATTPVATPDPSSDPDPTGDKPPVFTEVSGIKHPNSWRRSAHRH